MHVHLKEVINELGLLSRHDSIFHELCPLTYVQKDCEKTMIDSRRHS
jgi:hypothetical protein